MATSNISLAKTLTGKAFTFADIKVGMKADFPSGVGGVITHACTELKGNIANFTSTNPEWPVSHVVEDGVADMTVLELERLGNALEVFSSWGRMPTDEERAIIQRAKSLGYAHVSSYTQASWTELGLQRYCELKDKEDSLAS